eukprot:COSAG01_NODE_1846_length_9050_cov_10.563991_5_plen_158_part_00
MPHSSRRNISNYGTKIRKATQVHRWNTGQVLHARVRYYHILVICSTVLTESSCARSGCRNTGFFQITHGHCLVAKNGKSLTDAKRETNYVHGILDLTTKNSLKMCQESAFGGVFAEAQLNGGLKGQMLVNCAHNQCIEPTPHMQLHQCHFDTCGCVM